MVVRTDEALWNRVKTKIKKGSKGGPPGTWSARKAQFAVQEYKRLGGEYIGRKSSKNKLTQWTQEDWGYVLGDRKGRYLPKKVRAKLTPSQKKATNKKKREVGKGKRAPYSKVVKTKLRKLRK